jgi:phosphoesterase RecJ-like protein
MSASERDGMVRPPEELVRIAADAPHAIVVSHVRPDGDAVGASLAMSSVLRALGASASVVLPDPVPRRYRFLKGAADILSPEAADARGALLISLDATHPARLGAASRLIEEARAVANIDHHVSNARFGLVNWVESTASSVGEMVLALADALSVTLDADAKEAVYTAILTDTGRFTYSNATLGAFTAAARLVAGGVDSWRVADRVYCSRTLAEWRLEVRARESLTLECGGRVATMSLSAADFAETGTGPEDANEFAAFTRTIEGVDVGLFLYEVEGGARTKVGVRTSKAADANLLAARFGGGGHARASGCTVDAPLAEARRLVLEAARRALG